jgi:hypothetical protein
MFRCALAALFLAALLPKTAAAQSQSTELVLVRRDAFLYTAPSARAERVRDPWGERHRERLGPFFVMRFVAERGDFVEVATLPTFRAADHCYPTVSGLDGLDLHLFVERGALAPVVPSRVEVTGDDEGGVVLAGGVGLTHRGGRRYDAHVRGATIRVELDPSAVGTRYRVTPRIPVSRGATGMLAPGARVDYGRNLRLTAEAGRREPARARGVVDFSIAETRGGGANDGPARAVLTVEPITERGGRMLAFVRNECIEVRGTLARRDVTNDRPPRGVSDFGERRGTALRPGTALYFADGSSAGRATVDAALEGTVHTENGRSCFDHPLRPGTGGGRAAADDVLTLCIDRTALAAARAPRR